jgi:hypothetical protein
MFIAAVFTIAMFYNQLPDPTINEWIKKMWYIYTMEYYSIVKKNEIMLLAGKWMDLEVIILSEIRQAQRAKCHVFSHAESTHKTDDDDDGEEEA